MGVKRLRLADVQPGMILGQQILDENGRTIIQEGARLTPMHVKRLEKWCVDEVVIAADDTQVVVAAGADANRQPVQEAPPVDRDRMREIARAVQERFQNVVGDPLMDELKRLTIRHLVLQGQENIPGCG